MKTTRCLLLSTGAQVPFRSLRRAARMVGRDGAWTDLASGPLACVAGDPPSFIEALEFARALAALDAAISTARAARREATATRRPAYAGA